MATEDSIIPLDDLPTNPTGRIYRHDDEQGSVSTPTLNQKKSNPQPIHKNYVGKFFVLILLLSIAAVAIYNYVDFSKITVPNTEEIDNRIKLLEAKLETKINSEIRTVTDQINAQYHNLQQELASYTQKTNSILQEFNQTKDLQLAEIYYLLNLAQYSLDFTQNNAAALQILIQVQNMLADSGLEPTLQTQIEHDITNLQNLNAMNLNAVMQELAKYLAQVENLPLMKAEITPKENKAETIAIEINSWQDAIALAWHELSKLITINYNPQVTVGKLNAEQVTIIQAQLGLKLDSIRIALLRNDAQLLTALVAETITWLDKYYVPQTELKQFLQQLTQFTHPTYKLHSLRVEQ